MFDLKNFRKELGLKQSDLSDLFKISQPRISAMEKTMEDLNPEQKKILEDIFGKDKVALHHASESDIEKFKSQLLVNPDSTYELMRKEYLGLASELMIDNKQLRKEIKELLKENAELRAKLLSK